MGIPIIRLDGLPSVADPVIIRPAPDDDMRSGIFTRAMYIVHVSRAIPSVFVTIVYVEHNW